MRRSQEIESGGEFQRLVGTVVSAMAIGGIRDPGAKNHPDPDRLCLATRFARYNNKFSALPTKNGHEKSEQTHRRK